MMEEYDSGSSFDGIKVDFDDDIDSTQSGNSFEIPDQGGGGTASATSASLINTRSATLLENGPNSCHSTSNWVLGVRHFSLSSDKLNERMANRGKNISNNKFKVNNIKPNYNYMQNRRFGGNVSKVIPFSLTSTMYDIEEGSAVNFDTYHSHHLNHNNQQIIGVTKIKDKRQQYTTPADQIFNSESKDNKENCLKYVCQPNHHLRAEALDTNNEKISPAIPSSSKSTVKNDSVIEENGIPNPNIEVRTKTCDNSHSQNTTITEFPAQKKNSTKNRSSEQNKISIKLSNNNKRSVNSIRLSAKQELQRYRRQLFCESVSLIIIIIGIILVTITPFLLIPIWVIPNEYSSLIRNFLWLSLLTSVILLTLAALTGNIYWYYDEKSQKWKWFYHCGKGPTDHYWGATLLHNQKPFNIKNQTNVSVNV